MNLPLRYPAVFVTSLVAGLFSLAICGLLVADFVGRGQLELFDSPAYMAIKKQHQAEPENEQLRQEVRELDLRLRRNYFRQRKYTRTGIYLLLAGVIVTLITARWAATLQQKQPQPNSVDASVDFEEQQQQWGRWAAVSVVVVMLVGVSVLAFRSEDHLSTAIDQSSGIAEQDSVAQGTGLAAVRPDAVDEQLPLPSREEYVRQWPRFRGPTGSGIASSPDAPNKWDVSTGEGVLWKTAIPLPGHSSAIIWDKHVFLTGASAEQQTIYCLNADDGQIRWQHDSAPPKTSDDEFEISESTGYAAPSMATDGLRAFAIFASGDLVAVDFSGNELWNKRLGIPDNPYGHGNSLLTFEGLLIVQFDQGSGRDGKSRLFGLDGATGDIVWEVKRDMPSSWASPIVVEHEGKPLLVTCAAPWTIAYSPEDGQEIWRVECLDADVGPSPVYSDGLVFVANETGGLTVIRAAGEGNITDTNVVWTTDVDIPDTSSPLVTDKFVILVAQGYMACFDRAGSSEEPLWEEDIVDEVDSSAGLVGNRIYLFSSEGNAWVFEPKKDGCTRIAKMTMGEPCHASPAFHTGRIYIRGEKHLFCLGNK